MTSSTSTGNNTAQRSRRKLATPPTTTPQTLADLHVDRSESLRRLISETAHDLRAPLTSVRESIRLVRDGDLGHLTDSQRDCLTVAINQCNCAGQLVDELVQSRQFDTGFPNVCRSWISIDDMRHAVEETLQPWTMPRNIHLLWDGPFGRGEKIYGDAILLRRLIVNLAGNSIRETRDGQSILIRAKRNSRGTAYRWSIVDQGNGISAEDMDLIAGGQAPASSSGGLGLLICRNLAAAHFSSLRLESRVGTGTAASFETVTGGPLAVVRAWSRWRESILDSSASTPSRESADRAERISSPRRMRIDTPASNSIELGCQNQTPMFNDVVLTSVSLGAASSLESANDFEKNLQRSMQVSELGYRVSDRTWVIAWDADTRSAVVRRNELENHRGEHGPARLQWKDFRVVSDTSQRVLANRMSDLLVRAALSDLQVVDDLPQLSEPIQPSIVAATRLEQQVQRLRGQHLYG
ncbi:MAG: HAMP domain-containing sensor histidine kinase [Planctomycetota bacterium]